MHIQTFCPIQPRQAQEEHYGPIHFVKFQNFQICRSRQGYKHFYCLKLLHKPSHFTYHTAERKLWLLTCRCSMASRCMRARNIKYSSSICSTCLFSHFGVSSDHNLSRSMQSFSTWSKKPKLLPVFAKMSYSFFYFILVFQFLQVMIVFSFNLYKANACEN